MVAALMHARTPELRLIAGFVLAVLLTSGCGGQGAPAALPVEDDFSDCSAGWSTDEDESVSPSCAGGEYRVLMEEPPWLNSRIFFDAASKAMSVEVDATSEFGPRNAAWGVGCWASQEQGYLFAVSPRADWIIWKVDLAGAQRLTMLAESEVDAIPGFSDRGRLRGECLGRGADRPTLLALFMNGKRIVVTQDRVGHPSFSGFGLVVVSTEGGAEVRFDDFAARELTEAEVVRVLTAPTQEGSTTTGSQPPETELCTKAGIRYAGTTPEGAEVCFTLTPDGTELLESGYSFVGASGCQDMAEGAIRSDYPGTVDSSGHFETPEGLTATIRGDEASGVFADSDICPGKEFSWSARRRP